MSDTFSANAKLEGYKRKVEKMLKKMAKERGISKITFAEALRILIDKELSQ